ncbi:NUDIX hydrolase [Streptomyces platensis]|uniref:NUDIX hydrolase n=1 Tax=Streptomyces platensis TaxID=58346 RepID=UPI001F230437|nr:NUDIX domain-containing protein [Streptomyces platensis]MCF3145853.1 NUDIX domain-containing protein [Streptomyces platensis]
MSRRDYENDPHAPAANSLVPAASAVVVDDSGRVLLQRRRDNDMWALPGGVMEIGESLPDCAVRVSICFLARPLGGRLAVSEESTDVRWFEPGEIDALPMVPSIRKRLNDWCNGNMPATR